MDMQKLIKDAEYFIHLDENTPDSEIILDSVPGCEGANLQLHQEYLMAMKATLANIKNGQAAKTYSIAVARFFQGHGCKLREIPTDKIVSWPKGGEPVWGPDYPIFEISPS